MIKIGNLKIPGKIFLAPMAGITDRAFREICKNYGASLVETEMVSAKGILYLNRKTLSLMEISKEERPCSIQIFSSEPEDIKKAAYMALKYKPDLIDINMGCPVPKINKSGCGAILMKKPKLCFDLVKSALEGVNFKIPVTVKIRKGVSKNNVNAVEVAKYCEDAGVSAIAVHGRTKEDLYKGKVDLYIIKKVKEAVKIPVIGNGDIKTPEDARHMLEYTGCDAVMIGRGAIGKPYIFKKINDYLDGKITKELSLSEKINIMKDHIKKACLSKGESSGIKQSKKHIYAYLKDMGVPAFLKNEVQSLATFDDFEAFLERIYISANNKKVPS